MRNLEGRVAVVTGGASGIGEALARACARERMKVVVADIEAAGAERVAKAIVAAGGAAIGAAADVSDRASVEALADAEHDLHRFRIKPRPVILDRKDQVG